MNTKIVNILKYITIVLFLFMSTVACEKDFENVGGEIVDNGVFNTKKLEVDVTAYSKNIEASRVDNIRFLASGTSNTPITFGIYKTSELGILKASIASQIILPATAVDWNEMINDTTILDAVYLEIPYDAKRVNDDENGNAVFELNNIYGDADALYKIKVSRLETYLNLLDPLDPSKSNKYYSNQTFNTSDVLYPEGNFIPNAEDTVEYFDRTMLELDTASHNYINVQVRDTIKRSDKSPFIALPLNKEFFNDNFVHNADQTPFENLNDFLEFFRGILIEADGTNGSTMSLDLSKANIKIYYTNKEEKIEDENGTDLNGNGSTNETDVKYPIRVKKVAVFPFSKGNKGIRTNTFDRDYSGATAENFIMFPNTVAGEKKLYIQGAQGSMSILELFKNVDLDELRDKNWLINEASLTFYIDQAASGTTVPPKLFLYKLDPDETDDINENAQILDVMTEGPDKLGGFLQKDDDDNPLKYKLIITDYISELLKKDDTEVPATLGIKLYHATDIPSTAIDTIVEDYNWDPRGVVLYGNNYTEGDADFSKRLKLEIHYTEINE